MGTIQPSVQGEHGTLIKGALGFPEVLMAGLAQAAPAFSLIFTAGFIASLAGASVPLVFLIAMVGVLCTGNSLAQFSRIWPSAGSFVTFISRAIGPRVALTVAVTALLGYVILSAGLFLFVGNYIVTTIFNQPYNAGLVAIITIIYGVLVTAPVIVGVKAGLRVAIALYIFEVVIVTIFSIAILAQGGVGGLTLAPFSFGSGGTNGIALGLALGVTAFLGFEAPAPMAEETRNPRRNVPLAVLLGIIITGFIYVVGSYAVVSAFPDASTLATDPAPFVTASQRFAPPLAELVTLLLLTSVSASYLAFNSQLGRVIFNSAREGLWSKRLAIVHPRFRTPWLAIVAFVAPSLVIGAAALLFTDALTASGFLATYGGLGIIVMFAMSNVALIALGLRERRKGSNPNLFTMFLVPIVGVLVMAIPFYGSLQPGQPFPYSILLWLVIALILVGAAYTAFLQSTNPALLARAGSLVMGEYEPIDGGDGIASEIIGAADA